MITESNEAMVEQNCMYQDCDDVFGDDSEIEWAFEDLIHAKLKSESTSSSNVQSRNKSDDPPTSEKTSNFDSLHRLSSSPKCERSRFNSNLPISDDSGNQTHENDDDIFGDDSEIEWVFTDPYFLELQSKISDNSINNESINDPEDSKKNAKDTPDYTDVECSSDSHPPLSDLKQEPISKFDQDVELFDDSLDEIVGNIQIPIGQSTEPSLVSKDCTSKECIEDNVEKFVKNIEKEEKTLSFSDPETRKRTIESSQNNKCQILAEINVFENWPKKKRITEHSNNIIDSQVTEANPTNNRRTIPFGENYTNEAKLILIAVNSLSRSRSYLTFTELESVLKGPSRRKPRRRAYLSIDGLLKHVRRTKILHILQHMKIERYLEEIARKDKFLLKLGPKASELLSSGSGKQFIVPILPSDEAKFQCESSNEETHQQLSQAAPIFQRSQRIIAQREGQSGLEEKCYEELRKLTLKIADERGIDPCKLLSNDSLKQLSRKLPKSRLEMQEIYGISSYWYEEVGSQYLEICSKYSMIRKTYVC